MKNYTFEHIDTKCWGIGNYPAGMMKGDGGDIMVDAGAYVLSTSDYGDTWTEIRDGRRRGNFTRLADGSYISPGFHSVVNFDFDVETQEKIPFVLRIARAENFDVLRAGTAQCEYCSVDIPDLAVGFGDSEDKKNYHTGSVDHGVIQLENGDIIMTMYGQFKSDRSKLEYFKNYDFYQYRSWCLISHDNGHTFEYLSTIADCQTYPIADAEGYCEPDLLYLGNGHILAAIRTQGHEVYTPMFFSHSYDSGKTWSKPEVLNPYGVLPRLIRLENGAIVCASGKWDTFMQISGDEGYTWSKPFIVAENDGQWDRGPSGYVSIFETRPNEILIVYDTTEDKVSDDIKLGERRIVYMSRYRVIEEA